MRVFGHPDKPVWEVRNPRKVFLYATGVSIGPQYRSITALTVHEARGAAVWIDGVAHPCSFSPRSPRTAPGVETATVEVPLDGTVYNLRLTSRRGTLTTRGYFRAEWEPQGGPVSTEHWPRSGRGAADPVLRSLVEHPLTTAALEHAPALRRAARHVLARGSPPRRHA